MPVVRSFQQVGGGNLTLAGFAEDLHEEQSSTLGTVRKPDGSDWRLGRRGARALGMRGSILSLRDCSSGSVRRTLLYMDTKISTGFPQIYCINPFDTYLTTCYFSREESLKIVLVI